MFCVLAAFATSARAQQSSPLCCGARQSLDSAWWTGPMLAPSPATLPRGHFLLEPYFYDVTADGLNGLGSLTYALYGLADGLTVGLIPIVGFNVVSGGPNSSGIGLGDVGVLAQRRLTRFDAARGIPATALVVQETFPTGKYDRLGDRPSDGLGGGAYTTMVSLYSQTYLWLPNGRILRTRFNVSEAFSSSVKVNDVSVYGTRAGFRGHATPGSSLLFDSAWEYSLTRSWVLALDLTFRHTGTTSVTGFDARDPNIRLNSGSSDAFAFAPAIEYNWTSNLGVLLGTRVIPAGRNTSRSITPALAINFVH
jgi:hypothetical protein